MSEDLPKQDLILKLLRMTTSTNDGEALVAIRKVNSTMASFGWDWDKLIAGKIKVVADPFGKQVQNGNPNPYESRTGRRAPPPPPPPPAPRARPRPTPPPPPPPQRARINSTKTNNYAGWCYCCGDAVPRMSGQVFDPHDFTGAARSKWQIVCNPCNQSPIPNIGPSAYPRQRPLGNVTPNLNQI